MNTEKNDIEKRIQELPCEIINIIHRYCYVVIPKDLSYDIINYTKTLNKLQSLFSTSASGVFNMANSVLRYYVHYYRKSTKFYQDTYIQLALDDSRKNVCSARKYWGKLTPCMREIYLVSFARGEFYSDYRSYY